MLLFTVKKVLAAALVLASKTSAGKTQSVSNWGDNPSGLPAMLVYTPDKIAERPAIILGVRLHRGRPPCTLDVVPGSLTRSKIIAPSLRRYRSDVPVDDTTAIIR